MRDDQQRTVEVVNINGTPLYRVRDRNGYIRHEVRAVDELATLVNLASLEPFAGPLPRPGPPAG